MKSKERTFKISLMLIIANPIFIKTTILFLLPLEVTTLAQRILNSPNYITPHYTICPICEGKISIT